MGRALNRESRVPTQWGFHNDRDRQYGLVKPLLWPWFSMWSMEASGLGALRTLPLFESVFEASSGSLFPPPKWKQMKGCSWSHVTQHSGGAGSTPGPCLSSEVELEGPTTALAQD